MINNQNDRSIQLTYSEHQLSNYRNVYIITTNQFI